MNKLFIVLLGLFLVLIVQGQIPEKPSIHGFPMEDSEEISIERAPYQASLLYYAWIFICSGVIVSQKAVLTAAHCIMGSADQWAVHVGSAEKTENGQKYTVDKIVAHEQYYKGNNDEFDICLYITTNFMTIDGLNTAIIPIVPPDYEIPDDISTGYATAWGSTSNPNVSDPLRALEVPFINNENCREYFKNKPLIEITDNILCAGEPSDKCQADSGAPLAVECFLVGISTRFSGCGGENTPGIWIKMSSVSEWVYKWIEKMENEAKL